MEIKCNSIYHSYRENTALETMALEDITINIKTEKINAIIGKNGSGKTSFLDLIDGLLSPTFGTIQIGNYKIDANQKRKCVNELEAEIGYIGANAKQQFFLPTVKKEIAFGMKSLSYQSEKATKRIQDALRIVGLDNSYLDKDPIQLSKGEMKKISIASVLAQNPKILIFDQPTVGLDNISEKGFLKMIKILKNKYHKTIIIVTNDINMIHKVADYIYVFHKGKLVLEGSKYEVFGSESIDKYKIIRPSIMEFSYQVLKQKGIKLGYRDDVNDLIKDIYRHVS